MVEPVSQPDAVATQSASPHLASGLESGAAFAPRVGDALPSSQSSASQSLSSQPPSSQPPSSHPASPPAASDDWRARFAGSDKDAARRLARFSDEAAFYKSYRAMEQKFSAGDLRRAQPSDGSPEALAAWRRDNGLPETPDGYVDALKLPNGLVLGEGDRAVVAAFAEAAHAGNVAPAAFNALVDRYYTMQDAQLVERAEQDAQFHAASCEELRADWGPAEFARNTTAVNNMLATWPDDLGANLLSARTPDGRLLGDHPALVRQLAEIAFERNPAATLVPAGSSNAGKGAADRIAELKGWMGAPQGSAQHAQYWGDEKIQAEYRALLDGQGQTKRRAYSFARASVYMGSKLLQQSGIVQMKHDGSAFLLS